MKISARNILRGQILALTPGAINTEVVLEVAPGLQITAVITKDSAEHLKLKKGKKAYAIVKASSVMVGVD